MLQGVLNLLVTEYTQVNYWNAGALVYYLCNMVLCPRPDDVFYGIHHECEN